MNKQGQAIFSFIFVFMLLTLTAFATIEPLKETLNSARGYSASGLNCPSTTSFNSTAYAEQNSFEKIVYRPTCFVTGISMVWFVGAILISGIVWLFNKIGGKTKT